MTPCVCSIFGRNNQQDLFTLFGAMFVAVIFLGINNCSSVIPYVTTERNVLYRERFAGMYSPWAYSLAQVIIYIEVILRTCILQIEQSVINCNSKPGAAKTLLFNMTSLGLNCSKDLQYCRSY